MKYISKDLPQDAHYENLFDFVLDNTVRCEVIREFKTTRKLYKLMEALDLSKDDHYPFVKYQIIQYASIYEAIIDYLFKKRLAKLPEVQSLWEVQFYKLAFALWKNVVFELHERWSNEPLFICKQKKESAKYHKIKFEDKIDIAVKIGMLDAAYGDEIKDYFLLRNTIHIDNAIKKKVDGLEHTLDGAKKAYWRIEWFTKQIKEFLARNRY